MDVPASGGAPGRSGWHRRPARILLIDDEPLIIDVLKRLLSRTHAVETATSANQALGRLIAGERYDIIFCDILMPLVNGLDFFDEVSRQIPGQARRIVFVTGGINDPVLRARLSKTDAPVLDKPVDYRVLQQLADEYLELDASSASTGE